MPLLKAAGVLAASVVIAVTIQNSASTNVRRQADVSWPQAGPVLDQGKTGACVGFAVAGLLGGSDKDALRIYTVATRLDDAPGAYPAQDTGSTLAAAMSAAKRLGFVKKFTMVRTADEALGALSHHPLAVGLRWPMEGESHALVLLAHHGGMLTLKNSWGEGFGDAGLFDLPVAKFKEEFVSAAYAG